MDKNGKPETPPVIDSNYLPTLVPDQQSVPQTAASYGKSFKNIGLLSVAYFASLGAILLIAITVNPMFGWLFLGWAMFLPVYIGMVGGALFSTFSSKHTGKWQMIVLGIILCLISIAVAVSQYKHTGSLFRNLDDSVNLYGLAAAMLGGFAILSGIKSWRTHKLFSILIVVSATSILWLGPVLTNVSSKNANALSDPGIISVNRFIAEAGVKSQNKWVSRHNCDHSYSNGYSWTIKTAGFQNLASGQKDKLVSLGKAKGYEIKYPTGMLTVIDAGAWDVRILDVNGRYGALLSADSYVKTKPIGLPILDKCN